MSRRILIICITILFLELCLILIDNSDNIKDYIPFNNAPFRRSYRLTRYDVLFIINFILIYVLYNRYNKNPIYEIKKFWSFITDLNQKNVIALICSIIVSHICLWPILYGFLYPILNMIQSSDPTRRIVVVTLPAIWLLVISFINTGARSYNPPPHQQNFPPPPPIGGSGQPLTF